MKELIKIDLERQTVNARDLWKFLESKQDFSTWIKSRIFRYGFIEGQDYLTLHKKMERQTLREYHLSIEMAKELSMVQNSDKGREVRLYFIQCEKKLQRSLQKRVKEITKSDLANMILESEKELETANILIEKQKPKVKAFNKFMNQDGTISIGNAAKSLGTGRTRLFSLLREKKILMSGNIPYQQYIDCNYFKVIEQELNNRFFTTTRITPKGLAYISKLFLEGNKEERQISAVRTK